MMEIPLLLWHNSFHKHASCNHQERFLDVIAATVNCVLLSLPGSLDLPTLAGLSAVGTTTDMNSSAFVPAPWDV